MVTLRDFCWQNLLQIGSHPGGASNRSTSRTELIRDSLWLYGFEEPDWKKVKKYLSFEKNRFLSTNRVSFKNQKLDDLIYLDPVLFAKLLAWVRLQANYSPEGIEQLAAVEFERLEALRHAREVAKAQESQRAELRDIQEASRQRLERSRLESARRGLTSSNQKLSAETRALLKGLSFRMSEVDRDFAKYTVVTKYFWSEEPEPLDLLRHYSDVLLVNLDFRRDRTFFDVISEQLNYSLQQYFEIFSNARNWFRQDLDSLKSLEERVKFLYKFGEPAAAFEEYWVVLKRGDWTRLDPPKEFSPDTMAARTAYMEKLSTDPNEWISVFKSLKWTVSKVELKTFNMSHGDPWDSNLRF